MTFNEAKISALNETKISLILRKITSNPSVLTSDMIGIITDNGGNILTRSQVKDIFKEHGYEIDDYPGVLAAAAAGESSELNRNYRTPRVGQLAYSS
jgi:hypothetical protein